MVGGEVGERREARRPLEDPQRVHGVGLDRAELLVGQLVGLVEDPVRDRELADVVEQARPFQGPPAVGVEPQDRGDSVRDLGHAHRVPGGERRFGVDHPRERLRDPVQACVVAGERELGRLPFGHVGRLERGPEVAVAAEAQECVDERGVEPLAAPAQRHPARGLDAAGGVEHLDRLRQAQDPGGERDLLATEPVGHPAPVPVLVETANRRRRLLG